MRRSGQRASGTHQSGGTSGTVPLLSPLLSPAARPTPSQNPSPRGLPPCRSIGLLPATPQRSQPLPFAAVGVPASPLASSAAPPECGVARSCPRPIMMLPGQRDNHTYVVEGGAEEGFLPPHLLTAASMQVSAGTE